MIVKKRLSALLVGGIILIGLGGWAVSVAPGRTPSIVPPYPDPNNIPLYPGAQAVSVRDAKHQDIKGQWIVTSRITTYVTSAAPAIVLTYYKTNMGQYGWHQYY